MNRNNLKHLLRAPGRYMEFLKYSSSTTFFPQNETNPRPYQNLSLENVEPKNPTPAKDSLFYKNLCGFYLKQSNVLSVVFPPVFVIYALSVAVSNVLRYSLLMKVVGVRSRLLPLIIGLTDSALASLDVAIRVHGKWDLLKVYIVGNKIGPLLASILHGFGVLVLLLGCFVFGCKTASTQKVEFPAQLSVNENDISSTPCSTFWLAILTYTIGSFIMQRGKGLLWNVWSQVIKQNANEVLLNASSKSGTSPTITIDFHGKMAQIQVLLRYFASSFAPLLTAWFLIRTNNYISYTIVAVLFSCVSFFFVNILNILNEEDKERKDNYYQKINDEKKKKPFEIKNCEVVTWSDMLPSRIYHAKNQFITFVTCNEATTDLVPKDNQIGRFSEAFFHCGMFTCMTESVRSGYTRIICLRAATSDLTDTQLAQILSVVGVVATGSFWLSDMADSNRRQAASLSFIALAIGHFLLCCASSKSMTSFYISGIFFGLGEGISTGLRALIKQDYLSANGPLGNITEHNLQTKKGILYNSMGNNDFDINHNVSSACADNSGKLLRRQICNKIGIWADVTLVLNSIIVGVVGHWLGMRIASFTYGVLGLYATYFCVRILPDTKPTLS